MDKPTIPVVELLEYLFKERKLHRRGTVIFLIVGPGAAVKAKPFFRDNVLTGACGVPVVGILEL